MDIMSKVRATPECDFPVADRDLAGAGKFFGLYGGEHIAATEFVIGATLVQYGCSAYDILVGLAIGNLLATLCFALICAPIATSTRLSLYSYLNRVVGVKLQNVYNLIFGIGFAALGATGIGISATAIRRIFNIPIQSQWYPTSFKFILIVAILGAVIIFIAANGFEGVSKFASTCVPWMIVLFALGIIAVVPQLIQETGFGKINSLKDIFRLLNEQVWVEQVPISGKKLGIFHVIAFAWTCNVALHLGLNDMSVLRYAKDYRYGYISVVGMFVGHYFAWISAGIMGATAAIILNTDLVLLDSGEVSYTVLGFAGLLGVLIAGWTTANPTIYRVTLSFNSIFKNLSYKKMTYIVGSIITIAACFPGVQNAANVLTYLGLLVAGMGAICITEHYIFPKIGYTRYWNLYKNSEMNWAAAISWGLSLVFFVIMLFTNPIHQNFWFIPTYLIAMISYIVLAGIMGAKGSYEKEEKLQKEYEVELQKYVNNLPSSSKTKIASYKEKILIKISYSVLIAMFISGIFYSFGNISLTDFKQFIAIISIVYFAINIIITIMAYKNNEKDLKKEQEWEKNIAN